MASQVLSGASNPSYTNNTGQNVRIVINYMGAVITRIQIGSTPGPRSVPIYSTYYSISISWGGVSVSSSLKAIGKSLASAIVYIKNPETYPISTTTSTRTDSNASLSSSNSTTSTSNSQSVTSGFGFCASNNAIFPIDGSANFGSGSEALPTELMLAPNQTFSATCAEYNIVVIKEDGT